MGTLTKEEQSALDRLQKICDSHQKKTTDTLERCALLKQNQQLQLRLQLEVAERKKQDAIHDAAIRLQGQRTQAVSYVSQQIGALHATGMLIHGALWKATTEYDLILSTRAAAPILEDIVLNLAIESLPHLKLVGRAMKGFELAANSGKSTAKGWAAMAQLADALGNARPPRPAPDAMGRFTKPVITFGETLDSRANDILASIRNPIKSNQDIDAASQDRLKAYQAKNTILTGVLSDLHTKLSMANFMQALLHKYIFWYDGEDVYVKVQEMIKGAQLDTIPYAGEKSSFETLAEIILYDMLHAYTKAYFVVKAIKGNGIFETNPHESNISGLDLAQRKMIYERCGQNKWYSRGRSAIRDWRDLVVLWGGKLDASLKPFTLSLGGG